MNIRDYIVSNFSGLEVSDFASAINDNIKEKSEESLPGLGVVFEILWENSSSKERDKFVNILKDNIKKP